MHKAKIIIQKISKWPYVDIVGRRRVPCVVGGKFVVQMFPLYMQEAILRYSYSFPASWADKFGKRDLCHGSKFTVLSMQGSYLVTKSPHVILHVVWTHLKTVQIL